MIRPSSLIRGDEPTTPRIEAHRTNIKTESLDCGITAFGCCSSPNCQKLGSSKAFVIILIFVGIVQGAAERYFLISVRQSASDFGIDPVLLDWLLVSSGIFQGIFAIFIAYWGNRIHRISWLGGILILQSLVCFAVVIPILTHSGENNNAIAAYTNDVLCSEKRLAELTDDRPYIITTIVLFFISQVAIALGNVAFYTLGLSYLDDNVLEHQSPAIIGALIAAKIWGIQWGSALFYGISKTPFGWWLGWTIISPVLFILAILICLFPKRLLSTVVRQAADNIIEVATNNSQLSLAPNKLLADISFLNTMKRMLTNKILMFNVLATVLIETALVNFFFHEDNYLQSRFFMPANNMSGLSEEWTSRIITTLLKPPFIGLSILVSGLLISKAMPSPRKLAAWNIITATIVALLFVGYVFIDCQHNQIAGAMGGKLTQPFCSRNCICDNFVKFTPVCPLDSIQTYYSPCHAGCSDSTIMNGIRTYSNCSCQIDSGTSLTPDSYTFATEGACEYENCQRLWITFQILTVIGASLLGSGLIGNLLLTIRSVLPQDKSMALSMELWLLGLIVYVPGKIGYQAIADFTCQYWSSNGQVCYLHETTLFGNVLNIVTASLIGIGILFDIFVFIFVKDLSLYGDADQEAADSQYRRIPTTSIPLQTFNNRQTGEEQQSSANPSQPLLEQSVRPSSINNYRTEAQSPFAGTVQLAHAELTDPPSPSIITNHFLIRPTSPLKQQPTTAASIIRDEIDFNLQTLNENSETDSEMNVLPSKFKRATFGSDINPSVGDIYNSDRDSDLVIRQLESSVSSLSGWHESSVSPPTRNKIEPSGGAIKKRFKPHKDETDF